MAEFSTTKITPNDSVQIPSVNGQVAGYQENDELKSYILGTLPTQVSTNTENIATNTEDIATNAANIQANSDAITSLSATTEIDITSYFASDTALTLNTSKVIAYVHGDYVYISIDVTISNTIIHRISIPNSVLPPPIVTCAMSTVDWGNDAVTSQHGVVQWSGTDTRIQLRVSSANIRLLASVTYLKAST